MKKNIAVVDRILRMVIALILIVLFFVGQVDQPWKYVMFGAGVIFLITSYFSVCPIYSLFGVDTRQFREKNRMI